MWPLSNMYYNTGTITLTADENFNSYSTLDGYVYFDPVLGSSFSYSDILSGGTYLSLSAYPPLSALPLSAYTNTTTFLSSNNLVIRRQSFSGYVFTAPVKINFSLGGVQQSVYKIEKIYGVLNNIPTSVNRNFLNPSVVLNSISGTYETKPEFSTSYIETISCFRENFYVDVFDVTFSINQPSIFDLPANYKIINYQILDDNQTYLLTLEGYEKGDINYAVISTDTTLFQKPSGITIEYPSLNPIIT